LCPDGNNPLLVQFRKSPQCQQEFEEVEQVCQAFEGGLKTKGEKVDYVTSFFYQVSQCHCLKRNSLPET
jgi:hypothetical protein